MPNENKNESEEEIKGGITMTDEIEPVQLLDLKMAEIQEEWRVRTFLIAKINEVIVAVNRTIAWIDDEKKRLSSIDETGEENNDDGNGDVQ